ncbi:Ig-like domain-containing protein [Streptomyces sp. NPDC088745]|uniref:L,D-transpeptidase n=1 Tax=Streptomyces sp. NPDC088745 TaxID=3365884 RepID=UPI00381B4B9A
MSHAPRARTVLSCTLLIASLGAGLAACDTSEGSPLASAPYDAARQISFNGLPEGRDADPAKPLEVTATGQEGRITDVVAADAQGRRVAGELSADGSRWHSTSPLAAGAQYTVRVSTEDQEGAPGVRRLGFRTAAGKKALKVQFGPDAGTYGVGQPVTAELSAAVKDPRARAVVERALKVESEPAVEGSWYWVEDDLLHYRPRTYWPAGATVRARSSLEGIKVAKGLYGAATAPLKLTIGDKVEAVTDASSHYMTVKRNDEVINTIPVTTGKPGYATRNGVKVVLGKEYFVRMRGTSIGIPRGTNDSYDLPVYYATRVTWSGEYLHAAPWSVDSQGYANVSHGCTGMSTGNAAWFYENVREGDIVKVVGSWGGAMDPFGNGFGDWNVPWEKWRKGSALFDVTEQQRDRVRAPRLRPRV